LAEFKALQRIQDAAPNKGAPGFLEGFSEGQMDHLEKLVDRELGRGDPHSPEYHLIGLVVLLIVVTPWTEYYWHFDNFLRGGDDFEFGLLATITVFCLVLVLLQHSRQGVTFWFALQRWLSVLFSHPDSASPRLSSRPAMVSYAVRLPDPKSGVHVLPLRI
jgi:hypothetical protein